MIHFGSFEVPFLLLNPSKETLPILAYEKYMNTMAYRPYSMVINTLILIICLIILTRYLIYSNKDSRG